jgi:hypothetical protein
MEPMEPMNPALPKTLGISHIQEIFRDEAT